LKDRLLELLCIHGRNLFARGNNLFLTQIMRSKTLCPKCHSEIPLEDVNVATDIALCRRCSQTWSFAELVDDERTGNFNLKSPPRGTWFRENPPTGFEVGVSTRSGLAFFLVPFMCIWSGFSLGGIYGSQIAKGQFNPGMSLFGIPFLIGTLFLGGTAAMAICGKVTVSVDRDNGVIFTGVGPIGWRRRFNWRKVSAIRRTEKSGSRGSVSQQITFEGERQFNFASGVKDERLNFMLAALRKKWRESGR